MRTISKQLLTANNFRKIIKPESLKAPYSTLLASKKIGQMGLSNSPFGVFGAMAQRRKFGDTPAIRWSEELLFIPDSNDVSEISLMKPYSGYLSVRKSSYSKRRQISRDSF